MWICCFALSTLLTVCADRITGRSFATRSEVIARNGMAATSQPLATGVALENGDELLAKVVVSSVDPNLTFLKFMDERELPADFAEVPHLDFAAFRARGEKFALSKRMIFE